MMNYRTDFLYFKLEKFFNLIPSIPKHQCGPKAANSVKLIPFALIFGREVLLLFFPF